MCGIVGFISNDFTMGPDGMLLLAHGNRHRGEKDGIGFADVENRAVAKTMTPLEFLMNGVPKNKPTGAKGTQAEWDKNRPKVEENAKGFLSKAKESSFCFWHARSASAGDPLIGNCHPIRIRKNVFYIHNGTLGEKFEGIRNWLHVMEGVDFHTETDSEIAARAMELLMRVHGLGALDTVHSTLSTLFEGHLGVLIRLDMKEKRAIIMSDGDRELYRLTYEEKGGRPYSVLLSEPNANVGSDFIKAELIHSGVGHYFFGKKGLVEKDMFVSEDITAGLRDALGLLEGTPEHVSKCDSCDEKKKGNVVRLPDTTWDFCLSCYSTGAVDEKVEELKKKEIAHELLALNRKWPWVESVDEIGGSPEDLSIGRIRTFLERKGNTSWQDWMKMMNHKRDWDAVMKDSNGRAS